MSLPNQKWTVEWVFTSVQFWGEPPKGLWTVVVTDQVLYDPCEVSKKVKNQTVTKDSPEKPKPKPVDEAENVGGFHKKEINVQPDTKTIKEEFKHNSSMIERIVVEKYRLMNSDKATPSKNFNEFGDIKVIINDNSKNNAPIHEKPNNERRTEEPVQPEDSLDEYEEKLWQQEEMNVPRYEYTREINHEQIYQYKKSEKQDLQQLTGAVKLITLVFYGT
ncbi:hypothetical protein RF11_01235 [Thelohanellus kitauei]|uniref:P/Homo B domain-containing protein n=1 Tax=Thelohanellus kitauei TaxID=669202 RepID=A0A0C2N7R9_THEKT|nr:hypothetical protein RF11_01235 [Thelohanellus kitauei]